jgi:NADH dehydrogenase [ubiquinone] 1 alpha subcomplex assembly factor 1
MSRLLPTYLIFAVSLSFAIMSAPSSYAEKKGKPGAWRGQSLTEFTSEENKQLKWQIVNDGVMGGLSKGAISYPSSDTVKFSGNLSLKNNGGFSMMRTGPVKYDLSNELGLLLRVKGDGRSYEARMESDARFLRWKVSFAGSFDTVDGQWQEVKIPFESFKGGFRGKDLPKAVLDPSQIASLGILLADKQEGPFQLEIDWIRTYGKGQGNTIASETPEKKKALANKEKSPRNLIDTAVADGRFTIFKKALDTAGLTVFFQWDNALTVFAPTDEAFAKLPPKTLDSLLQPENRDALTELLSHHVVAGSLRLEDALRAKQVEPLKGEAFPVSFSKGEVLFKNSRLLDGNIECRDGIIHVLDSVMLPESLRDFR